MKLYCSRELALMNKCVQADKLEHSGQELSGSSLTSESLEAVTAGLVVMCQNSFSCRVERASNIVISRCLKFGRCFAS
jgi:hypothetical protein